MDATKTMGRTQDDNQLAVRDASRTFRIAVQQKYVCMSSTGLARSLLFALTCFQEQAADFSEPSSEAVRQAGGKGRFYVESKPSQGLLLIKGARGAAKELLERLDINGFLRKAQKSVHFKERIIEKVSHLLGLVLVEEEDRAAALEEHTQRKDQVEHMNRKTMAVQVCVRMLCVSVCMSTMGCTYTHSPSPLDFGEDVARNMSPGDACFVFQRQDRLSKEEEAKRRTLLRYVDAVKKAAEANMAAAEVGAVDQEIVRRGAVVQLPDSGIGDEEVRFVLSVHCA